MLESIFWLSVCEIRFSWSIVDMRRMHLEVCVQGHIKLVLIIACMHALYKRSLLQVLAQSPFLGSTGVSIAMNISSGRI